MDRGKRRKVVLGVVAIVLVTSAWFLWPVVDSVLDFKREGFFDETPSNTYASDRKGNLEAIHKALMLYVDSEGSLPLADAWMDAAWLRLQTKDLPEAEAKKKLRRPGVPDGGFGYTFNTELSGKHPEDVADTSTVLVAESDDTQWNANAAGKGAKGMAVTVSGTIIGQ